MIEQPTSPEKKSEKNNTVKVERDIISHCFDRQLRRDILSQKNKKARLLTTTTCDILTNYLANSCVFHFFLLRFFVEDSY